MVVDRLHQSSARPANTTKSTRCRSRSSWVMIHNCVKHSRSIVPTSNRRSLRSQQNFWFSFQLDGIRMQPAAGHVEQLDPLTLKLKWSKFFESVKPLQLKTSSCFHFKMFNLSFLSALLLTDRWSRPLLADSLLPTNSIGWLQKSRLSKIYFVQLEARLRERQRSRIRSGKFGNGSNEVLSF